MENWGAQARTTWRVCRADPERPERGEGREEGAHHSFPVVGKSELGTMATPVDDGTGQEDLGNPRTSQEKRKGAGRRAMQEEMH